MYILLEMREANGNTCLWNWDCMGHAKTEQVAIAWVSQNPGYRSYLYCPNIEIK